MQTSGPFSRRRFVGAAGAAVTAIAAPIAAPGLIRIAAAQSWRAGNPFSLGVASGAPRPDGFVLWTRLAPEPLSTNPETPGGMTGADVTLRYEIATDPGMTKSCAAELRPPNKPLPIRSISMSPASNPGGPIGTAFSPAMR